MATQAEMYDAYIAGALESEHTYEQIKLLCTGSREEAKEELERLQIEEDWDVDLDGWAEYVSSYGAKHPKPFVVEPVVLGNHRRPQGSKPGTGRTSCWRRLREKLFEDGYSARSVANIEAGATETWMCLADRTEPDNPVKGLVFGSVQSGKTSNMEALVSMAADSGTNVFIVLTGVIDSLRVQTRDRFERDLRNTEAIAWTHLDFSGRDRAFKPSQLKLNAEGQYLHPDRYVITCLKNATRLRSLLRWLYRDPGYTSRMRVLVIDDEADQASPNTAEILDPEDAEVYEQERKAINGLIVNLVNGKGANGEEPMRHFASMNYVSYTATPYANVLNERPGESLYPKDFIQSLQDSDEYFGANVIFGNPEYLDEDGEPACPGLDVVRAVPKCDEDEWKAARKAKKAACPASLIEAVCWFLCTASALRLRGHRKPVSMLVNTSSKVADHFVDRDTVESILAEPIESLLARCGHVYDRERARFTYEDLSRDFSRYGALDRVQRSLPEFDEISDGIRLLVSEVVPISIGDEGAMSYSRGINLCVDNCKAKAESPEGTTLRVIYPSGDQLAAMREAPAFIVIGGNTLSRGLTLEGLCCTYFTRGVTQADTLMQMARWFGYRRGCELYQRIWLTADSLVKYRALARADMELRREIQRFSENHLRPERLGVKVSAMHDIARFMPTAKNKMQMASGCTFDFTGCSFETTIFDPAEAALSAIIGLAERFIASLGAKANAEVGAGAVVWRGVPSDEALAFIKSYTYPEGCEREIPREFLDNVGKDGRYGSWNVAVAGKRNAPSGTWVVGCTELPRVERSRIPGEGLVDIGSMRSGPDALVDVREAVLTPEQRKLLKSRTDIVANRARLGMDRTPLLLIYRIDKDSAASGKRRPLGTPQDVIGISVIVPGDRHAGGATTAYAIDVER